MGSAALPAPEHTGKLHGEHDVLEHGEQRERW